jgi:cardiolipin synthase A/B
MKRAYLLWAGILLLCSAFGVATSGDFFAHYGYTIKKEAAVGTGELVAPLELRTPPPSYFSLYVEPAAGVMPVLERIQRAQKSIDLVMYAFQDPHVVAALCDAHTRGVAVRILLNGGYYTKHEGRNEPTFNALTACGVPVRFTPVHFALTHQKTLVVDGTEALVMTFNLQAQYYPTGRDFAVSDTDPADVAAIEQTFDADWEGKNIMAPQGDTLVWSPGSEDELLYLINSATSTLDVYNELMNDADITQALEAAAARGVRVRIVMTYATNWKEAFFKLRDAGVSVRTFASSSKKIYIHAKVLLINGTTVFVGSENFSENSLNKNRELGLVLSAPHIVAGIQDVFDADYAAARPFVVAP